jgi:hypothetical protein
MWIIITREQQKQGIFGFSIFHSAIANWQSAILCGRHSADKSYNLRRFSAELLGFALDADRVNMVKTR